jgi:hypothetical protein
MNRKVFALPVVVAVAVLVGSNLFAPTQPQAQAPAWDVTTIDLPFLPPAPPVVTPKVPPSDGAGYQPKADPKCQCVNCNCDELEKRVAALEVKVNAYGSARPAASNGSVGSNASNGSAGVKTTQAAVPQASYGPSPVYRQTFSQPQTTVVRRGLFGRTYTTTQPAKQCRVVNGVVVCN